MFYANIGTIISLKLPAIWNLFRHIESQYGMCRAVFNNAQAQGHTFSTLAGPPEAGAGTCNGTESAAFDHPTTRESNRGVGRDRHLFRYGRRWNAFELSMEKERCRYRRGDLAQFFPVGCLRGRCGYSATLLFPTVSRTSRIKGCRWSANRTLILGLKGSSRIPTILPS